MYQYLNANFCFGGIDHVDVYVYFSANEFEGDLCEIDISNPCSNFDLCKNNGTCHNQIGSHSCVCPAAGGFSNIE